MEQRKTVIVTGASRGLGAAAARAAGALGANVALNARSEGDLQAVAAEVEAAGGRALVVAGDVSEADACRRLVAATVEAFGRLDAVINNAGVLQPIAPLAEGDPAAWRSNILINVLGPYYLTRFAMPHLRRNKGRVINVSSGAAVRATEGWSAYCTAKAALNHFNRVLAAEEGNVVAIAVRPGVVDTAMQQAIREKGREGMPAESHQKFVAYHEEGELLPPEVPGRVLAVLALHAPAAWSGDFLSWDDEKVQALVRDEGVWNGEGGPG